MGKNLPGIRTTHASVPHKTPRTKALDPNGSPCSTRSRMDRKNNGLPDGRYLAQSICHGHNRLGTERGF